MRELQSIDLNLLVVLDQLLLHRSTSEVARRIGKSQSAVSHSLKRLRDIFHDPLFVRGASDLQPTARAQRLEQPLREALRGIAAAIQESQEEFDPKQESRTVVIGATDFLERLVLAPLTERLAKQAPDVELQFRSPSDQAGRAVQAGELDLALGAHFRERAGLCVKLLFEDEFVCVARASPEPGEMSLERYLASRHILVSPRGLPGGYVETALEALGKKRQVAVRLPHFTSAIALVANSDLLATVPGRLARLAGAETTLDCFDVPFALPTVKFALLFNAGLKDDPFHRWLRAQISEIVANC